MSLRLKVEAEQQGSRLDAFLVKQGAARTAAEARRAIAAGIVRVDGRRGRKGQGLLDGQVVDVAEDAAAGPTSAQPEPETRLTLPILYQDADLIAVDKPAGVPSHPLRSGERGTVANAIVARFPECAGASEDPREGGLAHRLDTGTSGVLIAARHKEAWRQLRRTLGGAGCRKVYLAEVVGTPTVSFVAAAIGRTGRRGAKAKVDSGRAPLPARTEIKVLERRGPTTLVEAQLDKGRAHQVRAHLAHIGCPIVGDDLYGDEAAVAIGVKRGAVLPRLHAARVTFSHPTTEKSLAIEAPPPAWATIH